MLVAGCGRRLVWRCAADRQNQGCHCIEDTLYNCTCLSEWASLSMRTDPRKRIALLSPGRLSSGTATSPLIHSKSSRRINPWIPSCDHNTRDKSSYHTSRTSLFLYYQGPATNRKLCSDSTSDLRDSVSHSDYTYYSTVLSFTVVPLTHSSSPTTTPSSSPVEWRSHCSFGTRPAV